MSLCGDESERCSASDQPDRLSGSSQHMLRSTTLSTSVAISCPASSTQIANIGLDRAAARSAPVGHEDDSVACRRGRCMRFRVIVDVSVVMVAEPVRFAAVEPRCDDLTEIERMAVPLVGTECKLRSRRTARRMARIPLFGQTRNYPIPQSPRDDDSMLPG